MQDDLGKRVLEFQRRIADEKIDMALIHDPDNIFYLTGFWGYLGMEFGRPTILIVPQSGSPALVTPGMEAEMAAGMTWVEDIRQWTDGIGGEWQSQLDDSFDRLKSKIVGVEPIKTHPMVSEYIKTKFPDSSLKDVSGILSDMRMVKSPAEIDVMRQAGQVAVAMCEAAVHTIAERVPEYEVSLAAITAGTRKAAEFIGDENSDSLLSPMIHNLQIFQSGPDLSMVHRRPTLRRIKKGDPVYMCFCPFTLLYTN